MAVERADGSFESTSAFAASSLRNSSAGTPVAPGACVVSPASTASAGLGDANRE